MSIARGLSLLPKAGRSCHAWAKCIRVAPVEARCFCCPDQHAVSQACSEQVGHQGSEDRGGGKAVPLRFFRRIRRAKSALHCNATLGNHLDRPAQIKALLPVCRHSIAPPILHQQFRFCVSRKSSAALGVAAVPPSLWENPRPAAQGLPLS